MDDRAEPRHFGARLTSADRGLQTGLCNREAAVGSCISSYPEEAT